MAPASSYNTLSRYFLLFFLIFGDISVNSSVSGAAKINNNKNQTDKKYISVIKTVGWTYKKKINNQPTKGWTSAVNSSLLRLLYIWCRAVLSKQIQTSNQGLEGWWPHGSLRTFMWVDRRPRGRHPGLPNACSVTLHKPLRGSASVHSSVKWWGGPTWVLFASMKLWF